ncbi:MAG: anaerobic carbon-monoxide dehydrogenase catalytic subunit [Candidatus Abyssobacteria bacterium SURF_17]|uniref:Carbon monoxide dehydrogenase n=1 Tax=Candidatus Abyssobacteria bacterium SURF_17 TaxID=2093361 RepID=A0A419EUS0_9BACT|nr:MAG: anaerobic carbon-monoxide dehydrogenase catalytic subunit [Candidatus Abyssubacteria bacterium SURF_17]
MKERSVDKATLQMLEKAKCDNVCTAFERSDMQDPRCGFGELGVCCQQCYMGPCRVDPFGKGAQYGACGISVDGIVARNIARACAVGASAHSDHGRDIAHNLYMTALGKTQGYSIVDERKLFVIAEEFGIDTSSGDTKKLAAEVAHKCLEQFGQQEGEVLTTQRAPEKQKERWRKLKVMPRGIDREIVEMLHMVHVGMDADYKNTLLHAIKAAVGDGWGGSMIATDLTDIQFGSPNPVRSKANLGVLGENTVNIVVHGHEPTLSEMIVKVARSPEMKALAKQKGAEDVTVAGICCTANEILMRQGAPLAGNYLQQELAIVTGAVEAMIVDVQCIMPGLNQVAPCYHTKLITTSKKVRIPGAIHYQFEEERAVDIAKKIVTEAIENYPKRDRKRVQIPAESSELVAGFTTENVFYHLGGKFRPSYKPLNEGIIQGRLRGVVGVVGCNNTKTVHDYNHLTFTKELLKHDVLIVTTGCSAGCLCKHGLLDSEDALQYCGYGLREICEAVGIPPVLHVGSCVDNSRILTACIEMVKEGGIGTDISQLPVAGSAPEAMSHKATSIGLYVVASGITTHFNPPFQVHGSKKVLDYLSNEMEKDFGANFIFEGDPKKAAQKIIAHLDKKREALKLKPMMYPPLNGETEKAAAKKQAAAVAGN